MMNPRLGNMLLLLLSSMMAAVQLVKADDPTTFFGGVGHGSYLDWYTNRGSTYFAKSLWMPTAASRDDGMAIHWTLNQDEQLLHLAVVAKATGWLGFGLSENGGMRGADLMLFSTSNMGTTTDAYVLDALVPVEDDCGSNWELDYNATTDDGFLIVEVTRLLDTGDAQDRKILDDHHYSMQPTSIIAAWGDSDTWNYHGNKRAQSSVRFFEQADGLSGMELFHQKMEQEADGYFFVGANNFEVPLIDTHYEKFCFNTTHLNDQGVPVALDESGTPIQGDLHIIGIEPVIDERARKYVHHFGVAATNKDDTPITHDNRCLQGDQSDVTQQLLYTWAAGVSQPIMMPDDVSYPMDFYAYGVEIHYDNSDLDAGQVDSSGVRMYYTKSPRSIAAGTMPIADGQNKLQGVKIGKGYSRNSFQCPSDCSSLTFTGDKPITVYAERYHMHNAGVRATNRVIRNGTVVHDSSVEFWDFDQNGGLLIQQEPFTILPGDQFDTTCYMNSPSEDYVWGGGSNEDMCVVYLYYYPRQMIFDKFNSICQVDFILEQCNAKLNSTLLSNVEELDRKFGKAPPTCAAPLVYERLPLPEDYSSATSTVASSAVVVATIVTLLMANLV